MTEVNESRTSWSEGFSYNPRPAGVSSAGRGGGGDWRFQAVEFAKGAAELSVEFGKGVRDVVKQNIVRNDSVIVRKLRGPCSRACEKLRFMNQYLPEDRDPVHAWCVILFVSFLAFAALVLDSDGDHTPMVKKMYIHPPSASRILLPDGRHLAYQEQGVSAEQARFSMIIPHSFLSSRLAGLPGIKASLLQEFGVRLVTYDLPGFGESDPHPNRNLHSSAIDLLHLSYAVNVADKFWVVGHSAASMHVWAALRYIPDRIAGAVMIAPLMNPYEPKFTKHESRRIWKKWTMRKKIMYSLARKFPRLLGYYYRRSFLSGNHGQLEILLSLSLGKKDRGLVEHRVFEEFWQRDVEESVRQGSVKPFVEEATLQVSHWGFSLTELQMQKKHKGKGLIFWLKSLFSKEEDLKGFIGPIHVWQGMEDMVAPPAMSDFLQRVVPQAMVHKLLYEGHYTYFYFCDECHRQMFTTVLGNPQGPLAPIIDQTSSVEDKDIEDINLGHITADEENATSLSNNSGVEPTCSATCKM